MSCVVRFADSFSVAKDDGAALATIAEVTERFNVTARSLRFYEQRGLLNPIRRGQSRHYDLAQQSRLQKIVKAKQLGFTLAEIAEMVKDDPSDKPTDAAFHLDKDTIKKQLRYLEERREEIIQAITDLQAALREPD